MMLAFNYFEPLADLIDKQDRSYTYLVDFLALWGLFVVSFGLLRLFSDVLSRKRVTFDFWTETVGRSVVAIWIAWLFVGFVCASLAYRPAGNPSAGVSGDADFGEFPGHGAGASSGWRLCRAAREGPCRVANPMPPNLSPLPEDQNLNVRIFDPESRFILKYYQRRRNFEGEPKYRVAR